MKNNISKNKNINVKIFRKQAATNFKLCTKHLVKITSPNYKFVGLIKKMTFIIYKIFCDSFACQKKFRKFMIHR